MSFDGCPPDLQSLRSKICLCSLKLSPLNLKTLFSIYKPAKSGHRAPEFGGRAIKNELPKLLIRWPNGWAR